jgi:hypothetical protein
MIEVKTKGETPSPPSPTPSEEGKGFPWIPVALIGGGVVMVAAALLPSKKEKGLTK